MDKDSGKSLAGDSNDEIDITLNVSIQKDEIEKMDHPTQQSGLIPTQYKQTKPPRRRKPKWRRVDKRREVSESIFVNPLYEYPPDHVSDGRLAYVYKQLKKQYLSYFSQQKPYLEKEIAFYSKLTSTLSQGILPTSEDPSVFEPVNQSVSSLSNCEGCSFHSSSLYHTYPLSNDTVRAFRNGKEVPVKHNPFTASSYSVTAICVATYCLLLLFHSSQSRFLFIPQLLHRWSGYFSFLHYQP